MNARRGGSLRRRSSLLHLLLTFPVSQQACRSSYNYKPTNTVTPPWQPAGRISSLLPLNFWRFPPFSQHRHEWNPLTFFFFCVFWREGENGEMMQQRRRMQVSRVSIARHNARPNRYQCCAWVFVCRGWTGPVPVSTLAGLKSVFPGAFAGARWHGASLQTAPQLRLLPPLFRLHLPLSAVYCAHIYIYTYIHIYTTEDTVRLSFTRLRSSPTSHALKWTDWTHCLLWGSKKKKLHREDKFGYWWFVLQTISDM